MSTSRNRENVYAYKGSRLIDDDIIHISRVLDSETGRGSGYFCLGCKRQMQAIKSNNVEDYFRHDPKFNKGLPKCHYSDETHRHKLAKEIIQGLKKVKVPRLYKFSPNDRKAKPVLLKDSRYVEAKTVLVEHHIFENSFGEIQIEHGVKKPEKKSLIVKPDVIFLDSKGKPILLIEIVATHKVEMKKSVKFKRLGIDAIQITIPKDSPENIERTFHSTKRTKWIYNAEEANTDYLQLSESHGDGIFEIDELQRKFFDENYNCRSFQIRELIRSVEILLESEHYRGVERGFRSEIWRVEENARRNRSRLDDLRRDHGGKGIAVYSDRRGILSREEKEFQEYVRGLEERYTSKRRELEAEERKINDEIEEVEFELQRIESRGENISQVIKDERRIVERIGADKEGIQEQIERLSDEHRGAEQRIRERVTIEEGIIRGEENEIQQLIDSLPESFELEGNKLEENYQFLRDGVKKRIAETRRAQGELPGEFERDRRETERKFDRIREGILTEVQNEGYEGSGEFTEELKELGKLSKSIMVYTETRRLYEGLRSLDR